MDKLDLKVKKVFPNIVVNKSFAIRKEVSRLPRFIAEYLIIKHIDGGTLDTKKLQEFINKYFPPLEEKNKVLYTLKNEGFYRLIDEFRVEVSTSRKLDILLHIPSLQIYNANIKKEIIDNNKDLLINGMWGLGKLELPRNVLIVQFVLDNLPLSLIDKEKLANIFVKRLEDLGVKVITTFSKEFEKAFYDSLLSKYDKGEREEKSLASLKNLQKEKLLEIANILMTNYIFFPSLKYDGKTLFFTLEYFILKEKRWNSFENKIVVNKYELENNIERFVEGSVIKFLKKEEVNLTEGWITLTEFIPYQVSRVAISHIINHRKDFTLAEWKNLIIRSIGLEPGNYTPKQKMLLLARLVPLVENNVNLVELGPKATGKTYIYRNASLYTRTFAGGKVSPAVLFYHGTYKILGEISRRDCIIFDELSKIQFPEEVISKLKDFMVDGFFERLGMKRGYSGCSIVFIDNIDEEDENLPSTSRWSDIFNKKGKNLPSILTDTALLDRINGYIRGWELPKISKSDIHLTNHLGFTSDILSEFFHYMRGQNFSELIDNTIELGEDITIRDEKGIKKIISGLLKILYPDGNFFSEDISEVIEIAIELRQNINKLLHQLSPNEFRFKSVKFKYRTKK
jgi:uncharacterized protein (TIGR02688 family)